MIRWNKQTRRRFYEKVRPDGDCLVWVGSRDKSGYGNCLARAYGSAQPHRAIYIQEHGDTDLVIDHLCSNRACVKLSHLEAVTQLENVLRSSVTKRSLTHCGNGHEWNEKNVRIETSGHPKCRRCDADRKRAAYHRKKLQRLQETI